MTSFELTAGFERGGKMVRGILVTVAALASAGAVVRAQSGPGMALPAAWGTAVGYTTVVAHDFSQRTSWAETNGGEGIQQYLGASWCLDGIGAAGNPIRSLAQIDAPDGSRLSQLQIWAYDVDAVDGLTVELWETCQPPGLNAPASSLLGSIDSVGAIGTYFGFTPLNDHRVDNANCAYTARVIWNPANSCKGDTIQLQKVQVSWVRDLAPAPASATFGDVPTSHPFFQYIEALAATGVTGGCGGGNYCPNVPLTRGQMAVFLSKALGLEWP